MEEKEYQDYRKKLVEWFERENPIGGLSIYVSWLERIVIEVKKDILNAKMPEEKEVLFHAMKNKLTVEVTRVKYNDKCIGKIDAIARRVNPDGQDDIAFSVNSVDLGRVKSGYCYGMSPWLSQVKIRQLKEE